MKTSASAWATPARAPFPGSTPGAIGAPPAEGTAVAAEYAGFWLRFLAYLIDSLVVGISAVFFAGFLGIVFAILGRASGSGPQAPGVEVGLFPLVSLVAPWLYWALMESSSRQATLGKMALGLTVTDEFGQRIGFGRATGRYFGKLLSWLPLGIGFLLAGFTDRKRALHDMVAGTVVVRRGKSGVAVIVAVAVAVLFGGIVIVGILAAIAIPNFLRYQLRAKESEARPAIAALAAGELEAQRETGRFVPLALPAGAAPGTAKLAWTAEDLEAAEAVGLAPPATGTYFTYSVAVAATADGREAFSICAESDIDGDGVHAAWVLWQPAVNEAGNPVGEPPEPPCTRSPQLERPLAFAPGDPIGQPVRVSPSNVF